MHNMVAPVIKATHVEVQNCNGPCGHSMLHFGSGIHKCDIWNDDQQTYLPPDQETNTT